MQSRYAGEQITFVLRQAEAVKRTGPAREKGETRRLGR